MADRHAGPETLSQNDILALGMLIELSIKSRAANSYPEFQGPDFPELDAPPTSQLRPLLPV